MMGLDLIMSPQGQLGKNCPDGENRQISRHTDIVTLCLNRPSGADSVNMRIIPDILIALGSRTIFPIANFLKLFSVTA